MRGSEFPCSLILVKTQFRLCQGKPSIVLTQGALLKCGFSTECLHVKNLTPLWLGQMPGVSIPCDLSYFYSSFNFTAARIPSGSGKISYCDCAGYLLTNDPQGKHEVTSGDSAFLPL